MSVDIPRDRYNRPLIIPPGGGKPIPYNRASSFGDVLDDKTNLEKHFKRLVIKGLTSRPDLLLAASTTPIEDKRRLNEIADDAIEAAGGSERSSIGTSLHALTELLDRSEPLPPYPEQWEGTIAAYRSATTPFTHVSIERFVVCDELQVAGTPDRVSRNDVPLSFNGVTLDPDLRICDLKTGRWGGDYLGKHAIQLAIYARSFYYDPVTGEREPIQMPGMCDVVDWDWGVIFHAPAGENECTLYAADLVQGWEGALLAADVRKWRKRKGLAVPGSLAAAA